MSCFFFHPVSLQKYHPLFFVVQMERRLFYTSFANPNVQQYLSEALKYISISPNVYKSTPYI